ncbi:MAG: hypothetical protein ACR2LS_08395 [Thermomicrobiales bacterium]
MPPTAGTGTEPDAKVTDDALPPLHLNPQRADVLLGPVVADLNTLEWRTERYLTRLKLTESDADTLRQANASLRRTLAHISSLRDGVPTEAT